MVFGHISRSGKSYLRHKKWCEKNDLFPLLVLCVRQELKESQRKQQATLEHLRHTKEEKRRELERKRAQEEDESRREEERKRKEEEEAQR